MKKILALALCFALVACLAVSVSAADGKKEEGLGMGTGANSSSHTINVDLKDLSYDPLNPEIVYSVTVDWTDANLVFEVDGATSDTLRWDPATHTYVVATAGSVEGQWINNSFDVTITNHSNAAVKAELFLPVTTNITDVTFDAVASDARQAAASGLVATLESAASGESMNNPSLAPTIKYTISADENTVPKGEFSIATNIELTPAS